MKVFAIGALLVGAGLAMTLFVPPARNKVFSTKLWPWALPWDTNETEVKLLKDLSRPGDVIVESNLHGWQWIALSLATTGTSWVHAALVDENERLLTVHKEAIEADWGIYLDWGSTRLALIRPPYRDKGQIDAAVKFARRKLGVSYDPSFRDHAGNCNGLVASALVHAGINVQSRNCYGREIFPANCFFGIPGAEVIWLSDIDRQRKTIGTT